MKMMILAGAVLSAALAACGGGSGSGPIPTATTSASDARFVQPQSVGPAPVQPNGSPWPFVNVTAPTASLGVVPSPSPVPSSNPTATSGPTNQPVFNTTGILPGTGEAFTLASAVPVFNVGNNGVAFEFVANTSGLPVAVQVGTASSGTDFVSSNPASGLHVNGSSVKCGISGGQNALQGDTIQYFACFGNPFTTP